VRRALAFRMATPMRLLSRIMTYAEFLEWARQFATEPFDDRRCFDQPSAEIRQMYVNSRRGEGNSAYPLTDFMPYADRRASAELDANILAKL
jgi:hypothetical protein